LRPFSKAASYIAQARTPLPDRMQMYNLLARVGHQEIFVPEFLSSVDVDDPARQQRVTFAGVDAASLVNRMLGFDWKYTLADNDLPKVVGATSLAGLPAGFPLLDARLVEFSLRLAPALKLKRLTLRWFFKEALRGYLPDEILAKQKHGFGLPFGPWLVRGGALLDMACSVAGWPRQARDRQTGVPAAADARSAAVGARILRRAGVDPDDARAVVESPRRTSCTGKTAGAGLVAAPKGVAGAKSSQVFDLRNKPVRSR
jgi:hypothetical protein